jgi:hypothetical protein
VEKMKKENIVALCLGLLAAGLLWQYYLKPMYDKKTGNPAVAQALREADTRALEEATAGVEGELVYRSDVDGGPVAAPALHDTTEAINKEGVDEFDFASTANRPPTLYEIAAAGDKRRGTKIILDGGDAVLQPRIEPGLPAAPEDSSGDEDAPKSRFTMIIAPVKHIVIKDKAAYDRFKKENRGGYPDVDFSRDMIVFLESDSRLSNGFFEISEAGPQGEDITVSYKVNIIGSAARPDKMAYAVVPKSDKKIVLSQIK